MTLDELTLGQNATVISLQATGLARRRLMDLGILPGTVLQAELRSPMGDPVAYRVRGALIALRKSQAREIEITLTEETNS
ncbi:MAG TPA: FeoA family protein [Candidatus Limnocylindrales bacterium]|nr:FeoA family protein [Candidatus Limnocylindrales bacterium]